MRDGNGRKPTGKLGAVVFDCDGLLLDTESRWTMAEQATVERWGGTWDPEFKRQLLGVAVPEAGERIAVYVGAPLTEAPAIARALDDNFAVALEQHGCHPRDGVATLVDALAAARIPMAVASNSAQALVLSALRHSGLPPRFSAVVCAGEEHAPKPAPDVYLAACAELGVEPSAAVALEDSQTGIEAARAAGLPVVGVPSLPGERLDADAVVATLALIGPEYLEQLVAAGLRG
ncbi:MAG: family phosphatase [Conexibacter sp.]|nr:family phosphatase [Conexibacter sp.]